MLRLILVLCFLLLSEWSSGWGFFAHRQINRLAVFTLPPPLLKYYKANIEYLTAHAVDADKRRYAAPDEGPRHFMDADYYEKLLPLDSIRLSWKEAVNLYTEDTLRAHGILPWHIPLVVFRLTEAFRAKDLPLVNKLSADLGHYIGDCHVPLHTTKNYNGQLSGQEGIHGLWESRLPELFSDEYDFFTGRAIYINNIDSAIWDAFEGSVLAKDSVLFIEQELNVAFPSDYKYTYEQRGRITIRVYSKEYAEAYHSKLNGMVERRMKAAVSLLGSLWFTAWVNAGQPDLESEPAEPVEPPADDPSMISPGKMIGRGEGEE